MYIKEEEIVARAEINGSEDELALLIKRLIYASLRSGGSVRFKTGKAGRTGGWDGVVQADESTIHVCEGTSIWELSNQQSGLSGKFDRDYARIKNTKSIKRSETSVVFATMNRWANHENWARLKLNRISWKNLYTLTASELAGWINQCPAVLAWARFNFGLGSDSLLSLDEYTHEITHKGPVPKPIEDYLKERDSQIGKTNEWLNGPPSAFLLKGKSREDAIGFFCGVVEQLGEEEKEKIKSNTVIVTNKEQLLFIKRKYKKARGRSLYIVIDFKDFDWSLSTVHQGHHLLIPYSSEIPPLLRDTKIPSSDLTSRESRSPDSISETQITITDSALASETAIGPKNSLDLSNPHLIKDDWMLDFTALLLLGGWSRDDQNEVELLLKLNPKINIQEFEKRLILLSKEPQAPVELKNRRWKFKNPLEVWPHLCQFVSRTELETFQSLVKQVLSDSDKQYDMPADKRWAAGIHGNTPKFSRKTKESISETLILLNIHGKQISYFSSRSIEYFNAQILNDVLATHWKCWASLAGILPLLAEASPERFLDLARKSIDSGNEGLMQIMYEGGDGLWGGSPHTSVLWALEVLAWNRNYLNPVTGILLKLSEKEMNLPQNLVNRPSNTLKHIFSSWLPQTSVNLVERATVIRSYKNKFPQKIFDLCFSLVPKEHEVGHHTAKPKYRWQEDIVEKKLTWKDVFDYRDLIQKIMAEYVCEDYHFISELLEDLYRFTDDFKDIVLDRLSFLVTDDTLSQDLKIKIWGQIRSLVHDQLSYNGARLVLEYPVIDELLTYYSMLEPQDIVKRYDWLFGDRPQLLDGESEDWQAYENDLNTVKQNALSQIIAQNNPDLLVRLIDNSKYPHMVAHALYKTNPDYSLEDLKQLNVSQEKIKEFFETFWAMKTHNLKNAEDLAELKKLIADFSDGQKELIFKVLPQNKLSWKFIESQGQKFYNSYWKDARFWAFQEWNEDSKFAVTQLMKFRRHLDNIHLMSLTIDKVPQKEILLFEVVKMFVKDISAEDLKKFWRGNLSWELGKIFEYVEKNFPEKSEEIASLEFQLLPLLENMGRGLSSLYKLLSDSPDSYAQLVVNAFKARNQETDQEVDENGRTLASVSYTLLTKWAQLPGQSVDGKLDEKKLKSWISRVRDILKEKDREEIGEQKIGHVLSKSPMGTDGFWPHEAVRKIIEDSYNDDLHSGFEVAVINSRGVYSKSIGEGGKQERELSRKYQTFADGLSLEFPNTSKIMKSLADSYAESAKREDLRAEDYE